MRAVLAGTRQQRALVVTESVVSVLGDAAPMPSAQAALAARDAASAAGVRVGCFHPPSVPDGVSRLRITHRADLDEQRWQHALAVLEAVHTEYGSGV